MSDKNKVITVDGKEYELQLPSFREITKMEDRMIGRTGTPVPNTEYKEYMKHIIVLPSGMTFEKFTELENEIADEVEKTVEVEGHTFTLVKPSARELAELQTKMRANGKISYEVLYDQLMDKAVKENVTIDELEEMIPQEEFRPFLKDVAEFANDTHFMRVMKEVRTFFRPSTD